MEISARSAAIGFFVPIGEDPAALYTDTICARTFVNGAHNPLTFDKDRVLYRSPPATKPDSNVLVRVKEHIHVRSVKFVEHRLQDGLKLNPDLYGFNTGLVFYFDLRPIHAVESRIVEAFINLCPEP